MTNARQMNGLPIVAFFVASIGLGGCTFGYEIRAVIIGGKLTFVPQRDGIKCANSLTVYNAEASERSINEGRLPPHGTMWEIDGPTRCSIRFPVAYGDAAPPITYRRPPEALTIGVHYKVIADGDQSGTGCFRIEPDGRVRNLQQPECDFHQT